MAQGASRPVDTVASAVWSTLVERHGSGMVEKRVTVTNVLGIHARPATLLVQAASRFEADIFLTKGDVSRINGKSIMGVMMLAAEQGAEVLVEAEGEDAQAALDTVAELLGNDFEGRL